MKLHPSLGFLFYCSLIYTIHVHAESDPTYWTKRNLWLSSLNDLLSLILNPESAIPKENTSSVNDNPYPVKYPRNPKKIRYVFEKSSVPPKNLSREMTLPKIITHKPTSSVYKSGHAETKGASREVNLTKFERRIQSVLPKNVRLPRNLKYVGSDNYLRDGGAYGNVNGNVKFPLKHNFVSNDIIDLEDNMFSKRSESSNLKPRSKKHNFVSNDIIDVENDIISKSSESSNLRTHRNGNYNQNNDKFNPVVPKGFESSQKERIYPYLNELLEKDLKPSKQLQHFNNDTFKVKYNGFNHPLPNDMTSSKTKKLYPYDQQHLAQPKGVNPSRQLQHQRKENLKSVVPSPKGSESSQSKRLYPNGQSDVVMPKYSNPSSEQRHDNYKVNNNRLELANVLQSSKNKRLQVKSQSGSVQARDYNPSSGRQHLNVDNRFKSVVPKDLQSSRNTLYNGKDNIERSERLPSKLDDFKKLRSKVRNLNENDGTETNLLSPATSNAFRRLTKKPLHPNIKNGIEDNELSPAMSKDLETSTQSPVEGNFNRNGDNQGTDSRPVGLIRKEWRHRPIPRPFNKHSDVQGSYLRPVNPRGFHTSKDKFNGKFQNGNNLLPVLPKGFNRLRNKHPVPDENYGMMDNNFLNLKAKPRLNSQPYDARNHVPIDFVSSTKTILERNGKNNLEDDELLSPVMPRKNFRPFVENNEISEIPIMSKSFVTSPKKVPQRKGKYAFEDSVFHTTSKVSHPPRELVRSDGASSEDNRMPLTKQKHSNVGSDLSDLEVNAFMPKRYDLSLEKVLLHNGEHDLKRSEPLARKIGHHRDYNKRKKFKDLMSLMSKLSSKKLDQNDNLKGKGGKGTGINKLRSGKFDGTGKHFDHPSSLNTISPYRGQNYIFGQGSRENIKKSNPFQPTLSALKETFVNPSIFTKAQREKMADHLNNMLKIVLFKREVADLKSGLRKRHLNAMEPDLPEKPVALKRRRGLMPKRFLEKFLQLQHQEKFHPKSKTKDGPRADAMDKTKWTWKKKNKSKPSEKKSKKFLKKKPTSLFTTNTSPPLKHWENRPENGLRSDRDNDANAVKVGDDHRRQKVFNNLFRLPWEQKGRQKFPFKMEKEKKKMLKGKLENVIPYTTLEFEQKLFNGLRSEKDEQEEKSLNSLDSDPADFSFNDKTSFYNTKMKSKKRSVEELRDLWQSEIVKMDLLHQQTPPKYHGLNDGEKLRDVLKRQIASKGKYRVPPQKDIFGVSLLKHLYP